MNWVEEELKGSDLKDRRRTKRLIRIVEDLSTQPNASAPQASRDQAALQGLYDFWSNPRISAKDILSGHQKSTLERIAQHQTVLAIQDTTELDYSSHPKTDGLGPINHSKAQGIKIHSVLGASAEGVPLGLVHQVVWTRQKPRASKNSKRKQDIQNKESVRWIESLEASQEKIPEQIRVITVADREADIYELFSQKRPSNSELLIRAAQNRNTRKADSSAIAPLFEAIKQTECQGEIELSLQRTPRRKARTAHLEIRTTSLWLQPPAHLKKEPAIKVSVIQAQETTAPIGETAVNWLLLTTQEIDDLASAQQSLKWYSARWLIERYHYTLKSGCRIEELQLKTSERLQRALATYAIVAWRLLWLTYEARKNPEKSVEGILETAEWEALSATINKSKAAIEKAPSLGESIKWIARLGGHLGRKGDGDPGVCTLWRGLQRLHDMTAMWILLRE